MRQAAVVSDIPVHRWVMENAVLFADPYDVDAIASELERLVGPHSADIRNELAQAAPRVLDRYSIAKTSGQWSELFASLSRQPQIEV